MEKQYTPVIEYSLSPSVLFQCLYCGVANEERQHGYQHKSTMSHCDGCQATYIVDWDDPAKPIIRMRPFDATEFDGEQV